MRLLAFSDVHRDDRKARELADMAVQADVVIAAGDFADIHIGLEKLTDLMVDVGKTQREHVWIRFVDSPKSEWAMGGEIQG